MLFLWLCPVCGREFKNENQFHSCGRYGLEDKFVNKAVIVRELYDHLIEEISKFGEFKVEPTQNAIMVKKKTTFLAFKPMKKNLDVEFALDEELDEYPVFKSVKINKKQWAMRARLYEKEDVTAIFLGWLRRAFELQE